MPTSLVCLNCRLSKGNFLLLVSSPTDYLLQSYFVWVLTKKEGRLLESSLRHFPMKVNSDITSSTHSILGSVISCFVAHCSFFLLSSNNSCLYLCYSGEQVNGSELFPLFSQTSTARLENVTRRCKSIEWGEMKQLQLDILSKHPMGRSYMTLYSILTCGLYVVSAGQLLCYLLWGFVFEHILIQICSKISLIPLGLNHFRADLSIP